MALDLFINDKRCDLPLGTVIAMSYTNNFIAEAIAPSGSSSNQFNLPKTQRNSDIFESADSMNSDTDVPYRKLSVRLLQNGRELISDGFAIVNESSNFYKVVVYGGNLDFFESIKGKRLRDIDFSDLDHVWNFINVRDSRSNNSGFIYPIIDWSEDAAFMDDVSTTVDPRTMYHAIFVHTIMDRIFSEAGFTKTGDILTDNDTYKKLIVPIVDSIQSQALKADREVISVLQGGAGQLQRQLITGSSFFDQIIFTPLLLTRDLQDIYQFHIFYPALPTEFGNLSTNAYKAPVTGSYSIKFTGQHRQTENIFFKVSLQVWVVKPSGKRTIIADREVTISQVFFNIDTKFNMNEGDFLTLVIVSGGTFPVSSISYVFIIDPRWEIVPLTAKNIYNTLISAGDNMPDMSQTDFVKSIARIFGIIFQTDSFSKEVEFRQFKDIYSNIPKAVDWTEKLDTNNTNKQPVISYHPKGYAQRNLFQWTNEVSQTLPKELGEGVIEIADETLTDEKTLIKIPFSATEIDKRLQGLDVPVIRFLKLGLPVRSIRPRILILETSPGFTVSINYNDTIDASAQSTRIPLCYFQLDNKNFNLGFDNSLISDNYNDFKFFLDKFKELKAFYLIDENDISDLDFFVPIYDDNYKHYFFISKLNKFIEGRSTEAILIRL